jgi:two-component system response regulator AlgR
MNPRILIVDDETGSRFMARLFLEEAGFVPDEAVSGVEALERCGSVDYDVVVLDQRMPGLSGIDVARELTESDYPGRILLFTAYHAPELEAEAERLHVTIVEKARKETLVEHVRELAELSAF